MQRISAELVGNAPLITRRSELESQVAGLLVEAVGIFDLARSFCPEKIRRRNVIARVGRLFEPYEEGEPNEQGMRTLIVPPIPEQPEQFDLPAIVMPARTFQHPRTGAPVDRRSALTMSLWYDWEARSGVRDALPLPAPVPDRIMLTALPIVLASNRFEEAFKTKSLETINGDYVSIYDTNQEESWISLELPKQQTFPPACPDDEQKDWGAFVEYPPERLTESMADWHMQNANWCERQLAVVRQALLDPDLNPRR